MDITFIKAEAADIPAIYDLNKKLIEKYENLQKIDFEKVLQWMKNKIESHINEYACVMSGKEKIGYYYFHQAGDEMEIDDLYIFPPYQNKGIGTSIIQKCLCETDFPIFLYVFIKNIKAVNLYKRLGFEISEIKNTRYVMCRNPKKINF